MKTDSKKKNEMESGYWMYSDGFAYWGIALVRNDEEPIKTDREVFDLPVEERLAHFIKTVEDEKKAKADKEAKEAAKATPKKA